MKEDIARFFKKLSLFILPLILVLIYCEFKLAKIPNSYSHKKLNLEKNLSNINVLVLGSSQSFYGINPSYFSCNGFNIADDSQTLFYDSRIVLNNLNKMQSLKCVIISISYFSFGEIISDTPYSWMDYFYYKYWQIPTKATLDFDLRKHSYIALYTPLKTVKYAMSNFNVNLAAGIDANGWKPKDSTNIKMISKASGLKRIQQHEKTRKDDHYAENIGYIEKLLSRLKERNINAVFITTPVYKTYSANANPNIIRKNKAIMDSLCKKYNSSYYDYFTDERFTINDFFDNDHLNKQGAIKFSKMLNEDFVKANCKQ